MRYAHSGRLWATGLVVALGLSLFQAAVFACVYTVALQLLPRAGTIVVDVIFATVVGRLVAGAARGGKVRNVAVSRALVLLVATFAYATGWVAWLAATFHSHSLRELPVALGELLSKGVGVGKVRPGEDVLLALYGLEAVAFLAVALHASRRPLAVPFCEQCLEWCGERPIPPIARAGGAESIRAKVAARDWPGLASEAVEPRAHCKVTLERCRCRATNVLTVAEVIPAANFKATPWVEREVLSREDVAAFEEALRARRGVAEHAQPPPAEGAPALPPPPPLSPEEEARRAKLAALPGFLRARAAERQRIEREAVNELVPNDEGVVHGPTHAEIALSCLRALAWSPVLACPAGVVAGAVRDLFDTAGMGDARAVLSVWGTLVALAAFWPLYNLRFPRPLTRVRARIFEKERRDVWYYVAALVLYGFLAACAFIK